MKKLIKLLLIASLFLPLTVLGAPPYSFTSTLLPNNSLTDVGSTTLSAYRNIVAQWFTATSTKASLFPYASTTAISAGNAWFTGNVGIGTTTFTYGEKLICKPFPNPVGVVPPPVIDNISAKVVFDEFLIP